MSHFLTAHVVMTKAQSHLGLSENDGNTTSFPTVKKKHRAPYFEKFTVGVYPMFKHTRLVIFIQYVCSSYPMNKM
jgi:hypothetical protein